MLGGVQLCWQEKFVLHLQLKTKISEFAGIEESLVVLDSSAIKTLFDRKQRLASRFDTILVKLVTIEQCWAAVHLLQQLLPLLVVFALFGFGVASHLLDLLVHHFVSGGRRR